MNIGEELQMALGQSSKLGSMLSGIFESGKSGANASNQANKGVPGQNIAPVERAASQTHRSGEYSDEHRQEAQTTEQSPLHGADGGTVPVVEEGRTVDTEEAELVVRAQGDPQAFGDLYERYVDRIYAYIYHRVGNAQDAEDLTARTFYKALAKLHTYEDRGFPFSAWLFRIAHNLVANWHRDHSRRNFLSLDRLWSHSQDTETPEHLVEREERHDALQSAVNRLPEERRNLLLYKFGSRLSNVEIGELMNKSESAIKSLYFRTLAALRKDLESRDW